MAGILDDIRASAANSGGSKSKFFFVKSGSKSRVRFLTDLDDGVKIVFHDSFEAGINSPCREAFGEECPYCGREDLRTRPLYIWSVYDYEHEEVKLLMAAVNSCTVVPSLVSMYDVYGTITDRDYVISRTGQKKDTVYSAVPMDKAKFRNSEAKPISNAKILEILDKAYPFEGVKKAKGKASKNSGDDKEENTIDYEELSAKELYKLCQERELGAKPKKPAAYYINLLEKADNDDEWDEEENEEMTGKNLPF